MQEEGEIMDLSFNKVEKFATDNATLLTFVGSSLARSVEANAADPIGQLVNYLIPSATGGPIYELQKTFSSVADLKWKLMDSPHAATALFKIGVGAWIASELGIIPSKWGSVGKKVATGAGISAVLLPGSGPSSTTLNNFARAPVMAAGRYY